MGTVGIESPLREWVRVEVSEAVERGIELLSKRRVNWADVDLATLNLSDGRCCILGQFFGTYVAGQGILFREEGVENDGDYGFSVPDAVYDRNYEAVGAAWYYLNRTWKERIAELQDG